MKNRFWLFVITILMCFPEAAQLSEQEVSQSKTIDELLDTFSPKARDIIHRNVDFANFNGVIPAKAVSELAAISTQKNIAEIMHKFLPLASHFALPVISNFYVGAVAQGESGALYLGANLEVAGVGLNNSIHAEQSAVNGALLHQEKGITRIAITAAPCGHCRQFLNEIKHAHDIEVIVLGKKPLPLKVLLPKSFGPADLGSVQPLFSEDNAKLDTKQRICAAIHKNNGATCTHSYAPHTGSLSSVLLRVSDEIFAVGVYIENAAYNPSLSPFLSALDRLRFRKIDFNQIKEAILVELRGAPVSQQIHTASLLSLISPKARVKIIKVPTK